MLHFNVRKSSKSVKSAKRKTGKAPTLRNILALLLAAVLGASLNSTPAVAANQIRVCLLRVDYMAEDPVETCTSADPAKIRDYLPLVRNGQEPTGTTVLGALYENEKFSGDILILYSLFSPCRGGFLAGGIVRSLPSDWLNKVTSFKNFNGCSINLHTDKQLGGESFSWYPNEDIPNVGPGFNDKTASLDIRTTPTREELFEKCNENSDEPFPT